MVQKLDAELLEQLAGENAADYHDALIERLKMAESE
jgi:hypothetical protein